jgi:hypothetical protein
LTLRQLVDLACNRVSDLNFTVHRAVAPMLAHPLNVPAQLQDVTAVSSTSMGARLRREASVVRRVATGTFAA